MLTNHKLRLNHQLVTLRLHISDARHGQQDDLGHPQTSVLKYQSEVIVITEGQDVTEVISRFHGSPHGMGLKTKSN